MINFRKLKHDYSPAILKEGRALYEKGAITSCKILQLNAQTVRIASRVSGTYENGYECEIEIDRQESETIDSNCDCSYTYDCHHLAALLFHLEGHFDEILVNYSREADLEHCETINEEEKQELCAALKEAATKEEMRKDLQYQQELLEEYRGASQVLGCSPFFMPEEAYQVDQGELALVFSFPSQKSVGISPLWTEVQLALRLPYRSKPLHIPNIKEFVEAVRYREMLYLGGRRYYFTPDSFDSNNRIIFNTLLAHARFLENKGERGAERTPRTAYLEDEVIGMLLASLHESIASSGGSGSHGLEGDLPVMPGLYQGSIEQPLFFSGCLATLRFELELLDEPVPKIFIKPSIVLDNGQVISVEEGRLFECASPGIIYNHCYYRFPPHLKRMHLRCLNHLREMTIPEPLFGTFFENALPQLCRFGEVSNRDLIDRFATLPYVGKIEAACDISYLNGELEAQLHFVYDKVKVPSAMKQLKLDHIAHFVTDHGVIARNLTEEQRILTDLFQDFSFHEEQGVYSVKTEKKIVEFMTEVIPRHQHQVKFNCPENLLSQFIYDNTSYTLKLSETDSIDSYEVDLKVEGYLEGVTVDQLWDCLATRRAFIELPTSKPSKKRPGKATGAQAHKILVLDLERLAPVIQIFDEIGINQMSSHKELRPLWSLANIDMKQFDKLPIVCTMTPKLQEIQQQMLGTRSLQSSAVPSSIQATLRSYQAEGVFWLERLRLMHLNGILADDMGLGKTLQAIVAITQCHEQKKGLSLVVCPTSLVYNWKEEFSKFNPSLQVLVVDGTPMQRKKLLNAAKEYDVVITSYSLLQKDIDVYKEFDCTYAILDEAQHIKNRGTRNAKSVKQLQAAHRLILTGTPIENSLEELWSLFDFLMPGLLSNYERFVEKYLRNPSQPGGKNLETLRRKVTPFILRRMKKDVLEDLPPVSEIIYHCHLSETQRELYKSYVDSAREELSLLVKKEGFDRVQIHVLATLTRLKQICCHPAIFAKEKPEVGDSAKYDMLLELLQSLIEGKHKTVVFSQYTRMLHILRDELEQMGIRFAYLDGSSKNRLDIVKQFNEDESIPVFLVSLKAGGAGLNLVGANTVIHYDMWWNPAVENQATDRVHRIGQKQSVSAYKLITLGTVEEKIVELQNRKKGLVKKVVNSDEEVISKLTWEEVLALLQA